MDNVRSRKSLVQYPNSYLVMLQPDTTAYMQPLDTMVFAILNNSIDHGYDILQNFFALVTIWKMLQKLAKPKNVYYSKLQENSNLSCAQYRMKKSSKSINRLKGSR